MEKQLYEALRVLIKAGNGHAPINLASAHATAILYQYRDYAKQKDANFDPFSSDTLPPSLKG